MCSSRGEGVDVVFLFGGGGDDGCDDGGGEKMVLVLISWILLCLYIHRHTSFVANQAKPGISFPPFPVAERPPNKDQHRQNPR